MVDASFEMPLPFSRRPGKSFGPPAEIQGQAMVSKTQCTETRVIIRPAAEGPAEFSVCLGDRMLVDAGDATAISPFASNCQFSLP